MASILKRHSHDKNARIKTTSRDTFKAMPMASRITSIMTTCIKATELEPKARPTSEILCNTPQS
jgi:hypothetical protein